MSKTATLKGKISLDDTEFHKVLRRATDRIKKFGSDAAKYAAETAGKYAKLGLVSLGTAGLGAAAGLLAAAKSAADLGGQLSDASAITGISADKLLVLQQAFANAGMEGSAAAGVVAKLQASIGKAGFISDETQDKISALQDEIAKLEGVKRAGLDPKEQAKVNKEIQKSKEQIVELQSEAKGVEKAFRMLGLNQSSMALMEGADQLKAVFEAIGKLSNNSDKLAALKMLRLPPDLLILAKDPNAFKDATKQLGMLAPLMGQFAGQFDRISDIINAKPGILFKQIGAGFLKELTGSKTLNEALNWFEALDLTSVGEKIGAQAAALVEIVRSTIENNGEGIWGALATGMDFLAAKAMETFIYVSQLAAGTAMGVFQTIFSEQGGQLAQSFGALLAGAVLVAAVQVTRGLKGLVAMAENDLKGSTLGKALLSVNNIAKAVTPLGGNPIENLKNAFSSAAYEQKSRQQMEAEIRASMQQPIDIVGMTPQELVQTTSEQAGEVVRNTGEFMQALATNIKDNIAEVRAMQGVNPATAAVTEKYNNLIRAAGPQGPSLYNQLMNGTPGVPINVPPRSQQFNRAPVPGMQWTYPNGNTNKVSGDTGAKQVSLLEQVASLLERNLTAMQVA